MKSHMWKTGCRRDRIVIARIPYSLSDIAAHSARCFQLKGQAPQRYHTQCLMRCIRCATKHSFFNAECSKCSLKLSCPSRKYSFVLLHHLNLTLNLFNSFSVHAYLGLLLCTPQTQIVQLTLTRHNCSFQLAVTCRSN